MKRTCSLKAGGRTQLLKMHRQTMHEFTKIQPAIGINDLDLDKDPFLCGITGDGKSELMKWLTNELAKKGIDIIIIDPIANHLLVDHIQYMQ